VVFHALIFSFPINNHCPGYGLFLSIKKKKRRRETGKKAEAEVTMGHDEKDKCLSRQVEFRRKEAARLKR